MNGVSGNLMSLLLKTFVGLDEFESNGSLYKLLKTTPKLKRLAASCPEESSRKNRSSSIVAYLHNRRNPNNENMLYIFISRLIILYQDSDPEDLENLINCQNLLFEELSDKISNTSINFKWDYTLMTLMCLNCNAPLTDSSLTCEFCNTIHISR